MRRLLACLIALPALALADPAGRDLPAHFVDGRVFVDAPLAGGGRLHLFTDSGGGTTLVTADAVTRLKLPTRTPSDAERADFDDLPPETRLLAQPLAFADTPLPAAPAPALVVPSTLGAGLPSDSDGTLGHDWFAGHAWTFDYPAGTLRLEAGGWTAPAGARTLALGFRRGEGSRPALAFPRVEVTLDGEPVQMLLDTGATTVLEPAAQAAVGGSRVRATSFITASHVAAWHRAHPDWPVLERAEARSGARMIRVADVRIAGLQVGPVWFTERPDANFTQWMSQMTDRMVEGSIGGNAFAGLRMTLDYPHALATFVRP